jgi:hypothetical protein
MFAKIRENLSPQINDDKVAQAALQAHRAGIDTPNNMGLVAIRRVAVLCAVHWSDVARRSTCRNRLRRCKKR